MPGNDVGASSHSTAAAASLRWGIYWLLIAAAVGQVSGRLLATNSIDRLAYDNARIQAEYEKSRAKYVGEGATGEALAEKLKRRRAELESRLRLDRPFLSSNDRSRWLTVRALVEYHTFEIDKIVTDPQQARQWDTIDMIKHPGWDGKGWKGEGRLYSSKPPLLATIIAGPYWVIYHTTGLSLRDDPHTVGRILLFLFNVIPLAIYFWLLAGICERYGTTDYGRLLVMATAAFGTFLTTFAVTLNNHLHAAIFVIAALAAALPIWFEGRRQWRYFAIAGFCAAMAVACELPALSFCVAIGLAAFWKAPRRALLGFLPPALLVGAAHLGTNYLSHGTIEPPYGMRDFSKDDQGNTKDWTNGNWYNYDYYVGTGDKKVKKQSYWSRDEAALARRSAIDRGEASRATYALHALVGHHGIFSLTPVWLLSVCGAMMMICRGRFQSVAPRDESMSQRAEQGISLRSLGLLVAAISIVCIGFYIGQGTENRNYGGGTSGLRWAFWLTPLWLIAMLPAADWIGGRRWARFLAALLLALSALSASYPIWNPWSHPWIYQWMVHLGWLTP